MKSLIHIKNREQNIEDGFTIIELMVSLTILSVILVVSTIVLIEIGGLFDKGVSETDLQNTTRNIMSDVSSALQFSGSSPIPCTSTLGGINNITTNITNHCGGSYTYSYTFNNVTLDEQAYCIGDVRYSFVLNSELGADSATNSATGAPANNDVAHVLWRDTLSSAADNCVPVYLPDPTNVNYPADLEVAPNTSGYEVMSDHTRLTSFNINLIPGVGSGDVYDVQISTAFGSSDLMSLSGSSTHCNSQVGSAATQFCSTVNLNTALAGRVY